ncbi:MAG TPA: hypothetical protein VE219_01870 [Candidatus Sulfotelmatobacter sp.]|nr:hypothetical protein [Candidatus Sulfotelmatobacter sp.]
MPADVPEDFDEASHAAEPRAPLLAALLQPRAVLGTVASKPRLGPALVAVLLTGVVSLVLDSLAALWQQSGLSAALVLSLCLPVLFLLFWLLSAWLISAGAMIMGAEDRRQHYLAVSGHTFPALIPYAAITALQSAALRWGGGAGPTINDAAGWLTLAVLVWFLVLTVLAIQAVYSLSNLSALSLALFPYAVLSGAVLLLIVAVSVLHGVGLASAIVRVMVA